MLATELLLELGRVNVALLFILGLLLVAFTICAWVRLCMFVDWLRSKLR